MKCFLSGNPEPNQHAYLFLFIALCYDEDGRESLVCSIPINTLKLLTKIQEQLKIILQML